MSNSSNQQDTPVLAVNYDGNDEGKDIVIFHKGKPVAVLVFGGENFSYDGKNSVPNFTGHAVYDKKEYHASVAIPSFSVGGSIDTSFVLEAIKN